MNDKLEYNIEETRNLDECLTWVKGHMCSGPDGEDHFKEWCALDEDEAIATVHSMLSGYAMFIRNTLKLWHDGPAVKWFNSHGIYHADDMSGIIFTSLHRQQNDKEVGVPGQIKHYRDYWDKVEPKVNDGRLN